MADAPGQKTTRTRMQPDAGDFDPTPNINRMMAADILGSPWLWVWVCALGTIALDGWGYRSFAGLSQGWCVLFVLLVHKQEGQLPALCLIGLMSLGLLPYANATFALDLGMLLSGIVVFRFAQDPPGFLRAAMHARISGADRLAIVALVLAQFLLISEIGQVAYGFDVQLFFGATLVALLTLRRQFGFLALLAVLCVLANISGLSPEMSGEGFTLGIGWRPDAYVILPVLVLVVVAIRADAAAGAAALAAMLFLAAVSSDFVTVIYNPLHDVIPTVLLLEQYEMAIPSPWILLAGEESLSEFVLLAPALFAVFMANKVHWQTQLWMMVVPTFFIATVGVYLGVFRGMNLTVDSTAFFTALALTALGFGNRGGRWDRVVPLPFATRRIRLWFLTFTVLFVLFQAGEVVLVTFPIFGFEMFDFTVTGFSAPSVAPYVVGGIVLLLLSYLALGLVLRIDGWDLLGALVPRARRHDFLPGKGPRDPRKRPEPVVPVIRARFAMLKQWVSDPGDGAPAQSIVDTLFGRNMRWIILGVAGFCLAVWCYQIFELVGEGRAFVLPEPAAAK